MIQNKNLPAFPVEISFNGKEKPQGIQTTDSSGWEAGLTKREYFAAMAMQGLATNWSKSNMEIAANAVEIADALLAELEK